MNAIQTVDKIVKYPNENVILADEKLENVGWYFVVQKIMNPRVCSTCKIDNAKVSNLYLKQTNLVQFQNC